VTQLDNVNSVLRPNYETPQGLISLASRASQNLPFALLFGPEFSPETTVCETQLFSASVDLRDENNVFGRVALVMS
jgi:hypothetical protein